MRPEHLSRKVIRLISEMDAYEEMLLSAISPWEFCKLLERGRLTIAGEPQVWLEAAMQMPKLRLVPLSPAIALKSTTLPPPFHSDPADQIIVASAREEDATVLTVDARIIAYPGVITLW